MNGRGPPLTALHAFAAVAEAGSVREAARRLGVGHSVVARHLRTLQDWTRCRLVDTGPAGIRLTEEGRMVFAAIGPAFAAIARLAEEFRPTRDAAPLEIWCAPGLASRWLTPRIAALSAALSDRPILVRPGEQIPRLRDGEADAAIVYGPSHTDDDGIARIELCRPGFFPVASRSWLALNNAPTTIGQLATTTLIHEHSDDQWRRWLEAAGAGRVGPLPGPRLWYANMALDAAEHGQGVALTNGLMAADALSDGRLALVTRGQVRLDAYYLIVARRRIGEPVIRALEAWLAETLSVEETDLCAGDLDDAL